MLLRQIFLVLYFIVLLDIVESLLPRGQNEWQEVALEYNHKRPQIYQVRDDDLNYLMVQLTQS